MHVFFTLALLLPTALLAANPNPKDLAVSAAQTAKAQAAIARLGNDDIDARDAASKELAEMKRFALPALLDALKGKPSNEVQIRVERLLPAARKDDFTARYPAFLADTNRKFDHDLSGWSELKKAAGDTPEARKLFANVVKTEERRAVLLGAFDPPAPPKVKRRGVKDDDPDPDPWNRARVAQFRYVLAQRKLGNQGPFGFAEPIEYLASGLLADLMCDRDDWKQMMLPMAKQLLDVKDREALLAGKGEYGNAVTKLAVRWVETRTNPRSIRDATQLCEDMKLGEELRRKCLEKSCEIAIEGGFFHPAVLTDLAKTGDVVYVATLRRFFDCESELAALVTGPHKLPVVQQRDVALAMCLLLTKQDPKEYGFDVQSDRESMRYYDHNYQFLTDNQRSAKEKRDAAFEKWAGWEKANPDALKASLPKEKK